MNQHLACLQILCLFIVLGGTGAAAADWRFEAAAETESRNAVAWVENAEGFRFSIDGSRLAIQTG